MYTWYQCDHIVLNHTSVHIHTYTHTHIHIYTYTHIHIYIPPSYSHTMDDHFLEVSLSEFEGTQSNRLRLATLVLLAGGEAQVLGFNTVASDAPNGDATPPDITYDGETDLSPSMTYARRFVAMASSLSTSCPLPESLERD